MESIIKSEVTNVDLEREFNYALGRDSFSTKGE
jgi:hypothetical protein